MLMHKVFISACFSLGLAVASPFDRFSKNQLAVCGFHPSPRDIELATLIIKILPLKDMEETFLSAVVAFQDYRVAQAMTIFRTLESYSQEKILEFCSLPYITVTREALKGVADGRIETQHKFYAIALNRAHTVKSKSIRFEYGSELALVKDIVPAPVLVFGLQPEAYRKQTELNHLWRWMQNPKGTDRAMYFLLNEPRRILRAPVGEVLALFRPLNPRLPTKTDRTEIIECKTMSLCKLLLHRALMEEFWETANLKSVFSDLLDRNYLRHHHYPKVIPERAKVKHAKLVETFIKKELSHQKRLISVLRIGQLFSGISVSLSNPQIDHLLQFNGLVAALWEMEPFIYGGDDVLRKMMKEKRYRLLDSEYSAFLVEFANSASALKDLVSSLESGQKVTREIIDSKVADYSELDLDGDFIDCILRWAKRTVSWKVFELLKMSSIRCKGLLNCRKAILEELDAILRKYTYRLNEVQLPQLSTPVEEVESDLKLLSEEVDLNAADANDAMEALLKKLAFMQEKPEILPKEICGLTEILGLSVDEALYPSLPDDKLLGVR